MHVKKGLIIAAAVLAVLVVCAILLALQFRSQSPESLLNQLARGKGDREDIIMRLNVARGDTIGPMITALQDRTGPASFRADVLELLFKRSFRSPEQRIEDAVLEALKDPDPIIRRKAAYGLAVYAEDRLQVALVDSIDDPDPATRRQAYLVLGSSAHGRQKADYGLWQLLSDEQKEKMIESCLEQAEKEQDPDMRLLARAVIGREIEIRGVNAVQALQTSDLDRAEQILRGALELDPENSQAQIRLVRFHLQTANREEALSLARQYGGLIEVPPLSESPVIDGDPTDAVWSEAYTTDKFYMTTSRWVPRPTKGESRACVGHRDGKLYVAILGYEDDLTKLIQAHTDRDGDVWRDDCVELVFDPDNTGKDFYQFVINPTGALWDCAPGFDSSKNYKCEYKASVFRDRGYWACEFAIDGKELDNHPIKPGTIWSLTLCRVRIGPASEHGSIWPLFGWTHRMELYPIAIFR